MTAEKTFKLLGTDLSRMPVSLKILLENLLRHEDGVTVTPDDIVALAQWPSTKNIKTSFDVLKQYKNLIKP